MTNLLRHILDLFPRKPKRIATQNMLLAREAEDDNRIDDAILLYRYELMDNPGNVNVHYTLARLYYHFKSDPTSAFYHANRALKLATRHDKALKAHSLGIRVNIHLDLDNTSKALADINQAISLLPNYADFFLQRAEIYFKTLMQHDRAAIDYKRTLALDNTNIHAHTRLAAIAVEHCDCQLALSHLNAILKLKPDDTKIYRERSLIYSCLDNFSAAIDDILTAYAIDPDGIDDNYVHTLTTKAYDLFVSKLNDRLTNQPPLAPIHGITQGKTQPLRRRHKPLPKSLRRRPRI